MSSYYRDKLNKQLMLSPDEGFFQLMWALNAIQSDAAPATLGILDPFDSDFVTTDITSTKFVYKWMIETLVNEKLTVAHKPRIKNGRTVWLDTRKLQVGLNAINTLRQLENSEDVTRIKNSNILVEMSRIASQQFAWQRGYLNKAQFYRNTYIYGQGACADFFLREHSLSVNEFSLIGFALFSYFSRNPAIVTPLDLSVLGVPQDRVESALRLLSLPLETARSTAIDLRKDRWPTAYKRSLLRQYPCIKFGSTSERIRCPLPQLILERITSGLFYDVVGGGGDIRNDYGRRFESYSLDLLRTMIPGIAWIEESQYKNLKNMIDTPDIRGRSSDEILIVIECKSSRMSFEARYGEDPLKERGYDDMVKAVFQLWRYFSHCRRKVCEDVISPDAVGMVLTLDTWLMMAKPLQDEIINKATALADQKDPEILQEDRRPILFTSSPDLEATLQSADASSFLEAARENSKPQYAGWMLSIMHDRFKNADRPQRLFPFQHGLRDILPWWGELDKGVQAVKDIA